MPKRLFIALPLPDPYLDKLSALARQYNIKGVRWTARQNLHVTVLFLGDIEEKNIDNLREALDGLSMIKSFELNFKDLSFAPPFRPPRMIWANFEKSSNFDNLTKKCFDLCKKFSNINPPYKQMPHITLARFKDYADHRQAHLPQISLNPLFVDKVRLMESILTPQGPIYTEIKEIKLKEKDNEN